MEKQSNMKRIIIEGIEIPVGDVAEEDILQQLNIFRNGLPYIELDRAATIGDGIVGIPEEEFGKFVSLHAQAAREGSLIKFVPASGAATRMFKKLHTALSEKWTGDIFAARLASGSEDASAVNEFLTRLDAFAFSEDLNEAAGKKGLAKGEYAAAPYKLLGVLLEEDGLNYSNLPKALIKFHRYPDGSRTAAEEHFVEALEYAADKNGIAKVHFTLSPEHCAPFESLLAASRGFYETADKKLDIAWSVQKASTNTIAVTLDNKPFLDKNNQPVFRPAGHGALLENVNDLQADIVFMKNIDNVTTDRLISVTYLYKKVLCGYLIELRDASFAFLRAIDSGRYDSDVLGRAAEFASSRMNIPLPEGYEKLPENQKSAFLLKMLNRPIRVCGMVKNEGLAGGGPFWVKGKDGMVSLQIIEQSQIDSSVELQKNIFITGTHFNPVDLVCSVRDFRGKNFNLPDFRDPETGFISVKSKDGKELKALELPGLWNGGMAFWNTIFVEVPKMTFNPVKEVNDLLLPGHT